MGLIIQPSTKNIQPSALNANLGLSLCSIANLYCFQEAKCVSPETKRRSGVTDGLWRSDQFPGISMRLLFTRLGFARVLT